MSINVIYHAMSLTVLKNCLNGHLGPKNIDFVCVQMFVVYEKKVSLIFPMGHMLTFTPYLILNNRVLFLASNFKNRVLFFNI